MLTRLTPQPPDKTIEMIALFREDPRAEKGDLGVGVYKDAAGKTPVMRAVKAAEQMLIDTQASKAYTSLSGDPAFCAAMRSLILGETVTAERVASAATPGGTGAIRQGFELIRYANPEATIWVSSPTWPNHLSILKFMGLPFRE